MSYILGALRNAEQDRGRESAQSPNMEDLITAAPAQQTSDVSRTASFWILTTACLLFVFSLVLWLWPSRETVVIEEVPLDNSEAVVPMVYEAVVEDRPTEVPPLPLTPSSSTLPEETARVDSANLVQDSLEDLSVEGVMLFDSDPSRSRVFINGNSYSVGDEVTDGLILFSIAENEIVFRSGSDPLKLRF